MHSSKGTAVTRLGAWSLGWSEPYEFIGFGVIHGPKPYEFIGFGDLHGPKPYEFIGFGDLHGPKPYKCSAGWIKNQPRRPIIIPFRGNSEF